MTRSAVNTRPPGRRSSHDCATSSVVNASPLRSSSPSAISGKLRSSSSGIPSMFSTRLVGRLRRFHGCGAATAGSSPTAVKYDSIGQLPVERAIARMPSSEIFSTGLPSRQPAARPSQAPWSRSSDASRRHGKQAGGDARQIASRSSGSAGRRAAGASRSSTWASSPAASSRNSGAAASGVAPPALRLGAPPAAIQRSRRSPTSTPSSSAATSAWGRRSSGCVQLRRSIDRRAATIAPHRGRCGASVVGPDLAGDLGDRAPRFDDVHAARLGHARPPALGNRLDAAERTGQAPAIIAIESESRP